MGDGELVSYLQLQASRIAAVSAAVATAIAIGAASLGATDETVQQVVVDDAEVQQAVVSIARANLLSPWAGGEDELAARGLDEDGFVPSVVISGRFAQLAQSDESEQLAQLRLEEEQAAPAVVVVRQLGVALQIGEGDELPVLGLEEEQAAQLQLAPRVLGASIWPIDPDELPTQEALDEDVPPSFFVAKAAVVTLPIVDDEWVEEPVVVTVVEEEEAQQSAVQRSIVRALNPWDGSDDDLPTQVALDEENFGRFDLLWPSGARTVQAIPSQDEGDVLGTANLGVVDEDEIPIVVVRPLGKTLWLTLPGDFDTLYEFDELTDETEESDALLIQIVRNQTAGFYRMSQGTWHHLFGS